MNRRLIIKSIQICYKECPWDSTLVIIFSLFLAVSPATMLFTYNLLISSLESNLNSNYQVTILLIICYCVFLFIQKSIDNFYNHYYLNYHTLLNFEKKMKKNFFEICSFLSLEDYFVPEIVNETRRAQNASINIFRVYQIVVEIITSLIGVLLVGGIILVTDKSLVIFLILVVASPVISNIYQIVQKKYLLYQNTQFKKEEEEFSKILTRAEYLK